MTAVRKAYQGAVDLVGAMPPSVESSPYPELCELTRRDYRRMGGKWERWAKRLARVAGELLTELDGRDEEARERWIEKTLAETGIKAMEFRQGMSMELEPAREMVAHWVGAARGMLGDAPNYTETPIEMVVKVAESPETFAFTLQRVGKLTPHQARQRAEAERDVLRAELDDLLDRLDGDTVGPTGNVAALLEHLAELLPNADPTADMEHYLRQARVGHHRALRARDRRLAAEAERDKALAALQAVREAQSLGEALAAVARHDGLTTDLINAIPPAEEARDGDA